MNAKWSSGHKSSIYVSGPSNHFGKQFLFSKDAISLEVFCNWEEIHHDGVYWTIIVVVVWTWVCEQGFSFSFWFSIFSELLSL